MTTRLSRRAALLAAMALTAGAAPAAADPKLSSAYLDFTKCKNLIQGDAPEGEDQPIRCQGPGGYTGEEQYSATTTWHVVAHPAMKEWLSLEPSDGQALSAGSVMEFRLCDGRPFAVIQRVKFCKGDGCDQMKKVSEILVVQGLIGAEGLRAELPTAKPNANERAHEATDAWVRAHGCPPAPPAAGKK